MKNPHKRRSQIRRPHTAFCYRPQPAVRGDVASENFRPFGARQILKHFLNALFFFQKQTGTGRYAFRKAYLFCFYMRPAEPCSVCRELIRRYEPVALMRFAHYFLIKLIRDEKVGLAVF